MLAAMDQLGSVGTYYPWGENKDGTNPQDTFSFATYWRDSATSLDYANNRYYSNAYGRFMTPDPYANSGRLSDPQSWNRYAYTRGDPVNLYDPAGLWAEAPHPIDPTPVEGGDEGPCPEGYTATEEGGCIAPTPEPLQKPSDPIPDFWANLGDDTEGAPVSLSKFGLTPQSVQMAASSSRLANINQFPQNVQPQFNPGADFTAVRNTKTGFTVVVFNQSNFWQATSSQMAGTLLHEILHISSNGNYALTDQQIANMLGVKITKADDSNISKKLATDCFPTGQ